jgi:ParB-like chromosome segregation protein Spo0J
MPAPIIRSITREHQHSSLTVAHLPIETIKPDPRNARTHSRKQVRQIAKSIESFGFNVPLLIDADDNVIAGHGRQ